MVILFALKHSKSPHPHSNILTMVKPTEDAYIYASFLVICEMFRSA